MAKRGDEEESDLCLSESRPERAGMFGKEICKQLCGGWKGRGLQGKREEAQRFRAWLGFWPVSEREKWQGERKHA